MFEELYSSTGVRQDCSLSPFLFNFIIEVSLSSPGYTHLDLITGEFSLDLEYADDIVLLGENADKMHSLLNTLSGNLTMFTMPFSSPKYKLMLHNRYSTVPRLRLESVLVESIDHFTYLGSRISPGGSLADQTSARIQKARLAFANLRHLQRRRDINLSIKGSVYCTALHSVLLYGCLTWTSKVGDMRRLQVFDHRYLRSIGRIPSSHHVSNTQVRCSFRERR
ncbi:unnamed protein product [Heterobilharzia americana]|nr:unnamed protein product [Heterobilharzia americana]